VAGTDRDCLNAIDLFFSPGAANLPEVLVTDTGSYVDLIFVIASLLGVDYRPGRADLPDQKGWRPGDGADYGSLNTFARGKLDLGEGQRLQARTFTTGKTGARRRIRSRRCCGRVRSDLQLPVLELLPDGSCRSVLIGSRTTDKARQQLIAAACRARTSMMRSRPVTSRSSRTTARTATAKGTAS